MFCVQKRVAGCSSWALGAVVPISRLFRSERFELLQRFRDRDLDGKTLDIGGSEELPESVVRPTQSTTSVASR
jgi:hypothetical protein